MAKKSTAVTTKAPPLPGMPKDIDKQKGVNKRTAQLGLEYLRAVATENEAKAARKGIFSTLAFNMHAAGIDSLDVVDDNNVKKKITLKTGNEKITAKAVKTPAPRAQRSKKETTAATVTMASGSTGDSGELPADVRLWPVAHLGANLLKAHVGQEVFDRAKAAGLPIGLTPMQVEKLVEDGNADTIGRLEAFMAAEPLRWWQTFAKNADAAIVTRVVESLCALRYVHPHQSE